MWELFEGAKRWVGGSSKYRLNTASKQVEVKVEIETVNYGIIRDNRWK